MLLGGTWVGGIDLYNVPIAGTNTFCSLLCHCTKCVFRSLCINLLEYLPVSILPAVPNMKVLNSSIIHDGLIQVGL